MNLIQTMQDGNVRVSISIERGKFVHSIVNQKIKTKNLSVLDLGSGEGGTAKVFSENNFVVSLDLSLIRLQRQNHSVISKADLRIRTCHFDQGRNLSIIEEDFSLEDSFEMTNKNIPIVLTVNGNALQLPFANHSFDLIIIQDVIEHLADINKFYFEVKRVLKNNGTNLFKHTK